MVETLAKKYNRALVDGKDVTLIERYSEQLKSIASAFSDEKFNTIISSGDVATSDKVNLIVSFVEADDNMKNFITLLGKNRRLDIIPAIACEMNKYISELTKKYTGIVVSNEALETSYVKSLEEKFAAKFDVNLTLENKVTDFDGVKVEIDGLGIEIGLSNDRLRTQMIEHILKAV
jgi:F-type H+-transporting ATPase subunit delta